MEITSPGLLPTGIGLEQLGSGASEIRNRMLVRNLKDMGLIEEWGRGIPLMQKAMREAGLPPPEFSEMQRDFRVTLYGPGSLATALNSRQQEVLDD